MRTFFRTALFSILLLPFANTFAQEPSKNTTISSSQWGNVGLQFSGGLMIYSVLRYTQNRPTGSWYWEEYRSGGLPFNLSLSYNSKFLYSSLEVSFGNVFKMRHFELGLNLIDLIPKVETKFKLKPFVGLGRLHYTTYNENANDYLSIGGIIEYSNVTLGYRKYIMNQENLNLGCYGECSPKYWEFFIGFRIDPWLFGAYKGKK